MVKNNIFDKNRDLNSNIKYPKRKKFVDGDKPSYVVNLEILSTGKKSDPNMQKVGSDTRPFLVYKESEESYAKNLKKG